MDAAVNRNAQTVVLTAIGAIALRIGITDEWTRYVNEWMKWPLILSGALLVALAFSTVVGGRHDNHPTTPAAWALLIPVVIAFVVQPTALGAYVADRRVNDVEAVSYDEAAVAQLAEGEIHAMLVSEFVALAATYGEVITDRDVKLTGFVTRDDDGWYLTRLTLRCCAADAAAFRVRVDGAEAPPDNQWVTVVGQWVAGTGEGVDATEAPAVTASDVDTIREPKQHYE